MIVHDYRIPYKLGETKRILMMSDIHYGNTQCDERAAKKKLNEDPEQYILLNGDQCDAIVLGDKRYTKDTDSTKRPAVIVSK